MKKIALIMLAISLLSGCSFGWGKDDNSKNRGKQSGGKDIVVPADEAGEYESNLDNALVEIQLTEN